MSLLRDALLGVSRSSAIKSAVTRAPVTRDVVARFVAGESTADAVTATRRLVDRGLNVTIDHLGEDTSDRAQADRVAVAYVELLGALGTGGLAAHAEVSVKLSALGQYLPAGGQQIALENARTICTAAANVGTTVVV